jgi:putative transposase
LAWRLKVSAKFIELGFSTRQVLKHTGVASSTWYAYLKCLKHSKEDKRKHNIGRLAPGYSFDIHGNKIADALIVNALKKYREDINFHNGGGYLKFKHYLKKDYGYCVNKKKIYRLCKEHKLLLPLRKKKKWRNRKICMNRVITAPNQLWEFDIKYGYIHGENRYFFFLGFIDVYSRKMISYYTGTSCKAKDMAFTLDEALRRNSISEENKLTIRSDHGTQMKSFAFKKYLDSRKDLQLDHEFIPPSTPNKNAHIESFNSIFETEFLQVRYFQNMKDVYKQVGEFIDLYNSYRVHSSLKYLSPDVAERKMLSGDLKIKPVRL